jgi:hypothetical protein
VDCKIVAAQRAKAEVDRMLGRRIQYHYTSNQNGLHAHLLLFILVRLDRIDLTLTAGCRLPLARERCDTAEYVVIEQNEVPVVAAWMIANLYHKRQLVRLPSRQMVSRVKLQRYLLHACLGNGYGMRGPPLRCRTCAELRHRHSLSKQHSADGVGRFQAPDIYPTCCGSGLSRRPALPR